MWSKTRENAKVVDNMHTHQIRHNIICMRRLCKYILLLLLLYRTCRYWKECVWGEYLLHILPLDLRRAGDPLKCAAHTTGEFYNSGRVVLLVWWEGEEGGVKQIIIVNKKKNKIHHSEFVSRDFFFLLPTSVPRWSWRYRYKRNSKKSHAPLFSCETNEMESDSDRDNRRTTRPAQNYKISFFFFLFPFIYFFLILNDS